MATAITTSVDDSGTAQTLKSANSNRLGLWIFNDSDQILYIKFDGTATTTDFAVEIAAGGFWECPRPVLVQAVSGIWAAGSTGAAKVTEVT